MKTRQELKAIGKARFKENRWNCVLALLLVSAVLGALSYASGGQEVREVASEGAKITVSARNGGVGLLSLLLSGPLTVGLNAFFVRNVRGERENLTVTTPFTEAFRGYPRKLGGSLYAGLLVVLWSLLLVIPGIIKSLSYGMAQYILADCPNVKATDAVRLSMRMMHGHKWEMFVLGLSFIGWFLLTAITFGLVGIFFAGPYRHSTFAAYYLAVRDEALRTGAVTQEQLDGTQPV